jgi:hypothetical protein
MARRDYDSGDCDRSQRKSKRSARVRVVRAAIELR